MNSRVIQLFDVTLRDGIQSISKRLDMKTKRNMLHNIISRNVTDIEIGSMVSPKILPQMSNSVELYEYSKSLGLDHINFYMLLPNSKQVSKAIDLNLENYSLITSVSESFQKKNINMTLNETKNDLNKSLVMLNDRNDIVKNVKLYVSCINECPIDGRISTSIILSELLSYYYNYDNITNICLSDTCGTLTTDYLSQIIYGLRLECSDMSRFSIHLHYSGKNIEELHAIMLLCLENNITCFDVSTINTGGCSVTINAQKMKGNLLYKDIYRFARTKDDIYIK
jgi:hydroxymethylglutaryl-CoA lyase